MSNPDPNGALQGVAIVGMSGRFPGARNLREFWRNLSGGVESITVFSEEELIESGVDPAMVRAPNFVKASGALDDVEYFDAAFFGISPREAEIMDPQYRFFLETTWEALEDAGCHPDQYEGVIGIYAGMGATKYLLNNLMTNRELVEAEGALQLRIVNDKDFLSSLTAYKLNLRGPSITVQAACSTSLVATCLAVQSLLNYQCDVALAGGVSISSPAKSGYFPQEGVFSADGHCRAFDAGAAGTVTGSGVGVVVLKRLEDAIADGDHVRAVIRGAAVNNDGSLKVGYTAPSVDGQAEVIAMAQALADVEPESITYVETHGTATPFGDPVEVAGLTQVFRAGTDKKRFCAIGSLKTNIGHLDAAAGVASLIKTVLSLEHKQLPPSLHFKQPNPQIDFENSPFYVNAQLSEWKTDGAPRRAGVSTFAVGGVNAHAILEEAPSAEPSGPARDWQLLTLSARTDAALETLTDGLAAHLKESPGENLADAAYTLQVGRGAFGRRRMLVCRDAGEAVALLEARDPRRVLDGAGGSADGAVAFMFPGLGNHYVNMGLELYRTEAAFREEVDRCSEILVPHLGLDLRDVLYPELRSESGRAGAPPAAAPKAGLDLRKMLGRHDETDEAAVRLNQTALTQPALFVIEYALAKLWMSWGVRPRALIGYSIGEYVAACLAGVFSLEDALSLVARRAAMIQELPAGSMLAVPLPEQEVRHILNGNLSLAAVNGSAICVVAGPTPDVAELERGLAAKGVACRRLQTSHAFHSKMMEPIQDDFVKLVESVRMQPPEIPFISNVTGGWITPAQATDPQYWATHMSRAVRFEEGVGELLKEPGRVLLEVGPGQALGAWAVQHPQYDGSSGHLVLASLRHSYDEQSDAAFLLGTLGRLWLAGLRPDWKAFYAGQARRRVSLPTYPFERKRFWISPGDRLYQLSGQQKAPAAARTLGDWFYFPSWKQTKPLAPFDAERLAAGRRRWLVFADECGLGSRLVERLRGLNQEVVTVEPGERFDRLTPDAFRINPSEPGDYETLLSELKSLELTPETVAHLWGVTAAAPGLSRLARAERSQQMGFFSLLLLAQALGNKQPGASLHVGVVTNNAHAITGEEEAELEKATSLGPTRVIPHEYQNITCQSVDVVFPARGAGQEERLLESLLAELTGKPSEPLVAYRGGNRWALSYEPLPLDAPAAKPTRLREGGVYLVTGGTGGIGLVLAEYLAQAARAKLALVARSRFPDKEEWGDWLLKHSDHDETSRKIRKLRNLEAQGAEVLVLRADVTDPDQMGDAVAATRERFGEINGVIHAAGVSPGGMIQVKTKEAAAAVLAPKVTGTLILDELLGESVPDFVIFCSSLAAILGGFGLVDHCAANSFLDAFARGHAHRRKTAVLSVNWDSWLEVGQAANAELSLGLKEILQKPVYSPVEHPLLDKYTADASGQEIYLSEFSTARQWVLDEHRIMGHGVVPGTAYIEMIRKAFEPHAEGRPVMIRKLLFANPLMVKDGESQQVQTVIERDGEGFRFRVLSASAAEGREPVWQEHVNGKIDLLDAAPPRRHDVAEIAARCAEKEIVVEEILDYSREVEESRKRKSLNLGKRWQNLLRRVHVGQGEVLAQLELPEEFAADLEEFRVHPSLMDAATGIVQAVGEALFMPLGYEKLKIWAPMTRRIYSYVKSKEGGFADKDTIACDVVIMDEQGMELLHAEDYIVKRVMNVGGLGQAGARRPADDPPPEIAVAASHVAARAENGGGPDAPERGISPAQGVEAFARLLSASALPPQVVVSTSDFPALVEQSGEFTRARILDEISKLQSRRRKHPRPNVPTQFVAPRNDVESKLAEIWKETLSVEEVGIYDNFFELGGDSLLATQLISRLGETFYVDFSLRTLFECPTVTDLAVLIVQKQADQADEEALAAVLAEIKQLSEGELQASLRAEKSMTADRESHE